MMTSFTKDRSRQSGLKLNSNRKVRTSPTAGTSAGNSLNLKAKHNFNRWSILWDNDTNYNKFSIKSVFN